MSMRERKLRAYVFRQKAVEAEAKAAREGSSEPTRRAWLILAREWTKMADREYPQYHPATVSKLAT